MTSRLKKLVAVTVPAMLLAALVAMIAIEAWVRLRWDDRRGTPGFYLSDPVLGQRLAPGYQGWFAGAPVEINALGFRDSRAYALEKKPNTFRILVLGDSVTFGHGALFDTTYPYLLEQRLRQWRPEIDWQVWNLGVPGYNTRTELDYLKRVGPTYRPDLVIVGFFENDLADNRVREATWQRRAASALQRGMQRWLYSYEFYKKVALTARWRWFTTTPDRNRIDALGADEALLALPPDRTGEPSQRLTSVDRFDDYATFRCGIDRNPNRDRLTTHLEAQTPEMTEWKQAVEEFQQLNREGVYRIAFFINMAPDMCSIADRFHDGGAVEDEEALRKILGNGTPVTGSVRAFLPYRPSQMPGANGHSIGNSNRVKADALFDFLAADVLPPLVRH